jgi:hypothetical protein
MRWTAALPVLSLSDDAGSRLPVIALPEQDVEHGNGVSAVAVAWYERGQEITVHFRDEDRPDKCSDMAYDCLRSPLFGRRSDIETFFLLQADGEVFFPGTASGDAAWSAAAPAHLTASIPLDQFQRDGAGRPIVYVNTWNHLFGHKNNNEHMPLVSSRPAAGSAVAVANDGARVPLYPVLSASRAEVDRQYRGCIRSLNATMTPALQGKLGARLPSPEAGAPQSLDAKMMSRQ